MLRTRTGIPPLAPPDETLLGLPVLSTPTALRLYGWDPEAVSESSLSTKTVDDPARSLRSLGTGEEDLPARPNEATEG
jgi:hypothetical protein